MLKTYIFILFITVSSLYSNDEISKQIWGNLILGSMINDDLHIELDFEPKLEVAKEEKWANIDMTPLIEYYPNKWIDLTAEIVIGYTKQTNDINSIELSPRLGIRFNIFGNIRQHLPTYKYLQLERFNLSTLFRYEYRSLFFNNNSSEKQSRLRARLETKTAFNHEDISHDDTYYLFADIERYFNLDKEVEEVFSNKARLRLGPGYRYNHKHSFELLMIYDLAKNTIEGDARNDAYAINFRYKIFY